MVARQNHSRAPMSSKKSGSNTENKDNRKLHSHTLVKGSKNQTICYILLDSIKRDYPPFLMPCLGTFNEDGTEIINFGSFSSGIEKENDCYLIDKQRRINIICYEMFLLAKKQPALRKGN